MKNKITLFKYWNNKFFWGKMAKYLSKLVFVGAFLAFWGTGINHAYAQLNRIPVITTQ